MTTYILRKIKIHTILLTSFLGLAILWGPTASADPIDEVADAVFGQDDDFTTNTANKGGLSASSLWNPTSIDLDSPFGANLGGNLYIADRDNNRVLIYFFPLALPTTAPALDKAADLIIGQDNSTSNLANKGGPPSASTLSEPCGLILRFDGTLYVADCGNHRVLIYLDIFNTDLVADFVLGQPDFDTGTVNNDVTASSFNPTEVMVDAAGNVYVSDGNNHRALVFLDPINTDSVADLVFGQQDDFTTNTDNKGGVSASSLSNFIGTLTVEAAGTVNAGGTVYIADTANNRVLGYFDPLNTDTVADVVFGQDDDFTTNDANKGGLSASSLFGPTVATVDAVGNVHITDSNNHRVLEYRAPLTTDKVADVVLGQDDFTSNAANKGGPPSASSLFAPTITFADSFGNIYVDDAGNNRVLVYDGTLDHNPLTCAGYDDPFASPLALAQKSNRPIPLSMTLTDSNSGVITDADISAPPVVNVTFGGQSLGVVPPNPDVLPGTKKAKAAKKGNIFEFDGSIAKWIYNLDTALYAAPGKYTVTPVPGDNSYTINTRTGCLQTFDRLD